MFDYDNDVSTNSEKQDHETEKQPPTPMRRKSHSVDNNNVSGGGNIQLHSKDIDGTASLNSDDGIGVTPPQPPARKTSFATLPNTTTWQQQSVNYPKTDTQSEHCQRIFLFTLNCPFIMIFLFVSLAVDVERPNIDAIHLSMVHMKLEEKRRKMEQEKRKEEIALSRQQQKVGKAAFLQAINKVCVLQLNF